MRNEYMQNFFGIKMLFHSACCFTIKNVIFSSRERERREGEKMIDAIFIRIKLMATRPIRVVA